eukprot:1432223-Prymnesium_polylepis.1
MVFESQRELQAAWSCWRLWEPLTGGKVGVAGSTKTVVTDVRWRNRKACSCTPADPKLVTGRGTAVPLMPHDAAYAHLGVPRRADGVGAPARTSLDRKLMAIIARLRAMSRPTPDEFTVASAGLLETTGGYYLQTIYLSFEELKAFESKWRGVFNQFFHRDPSAPRLELSVYASCAPAGGKERAVGDLGAKSGHLRTGTPPW